MRQNIVLTVHAGSLACGLMLGILFTGSAWYGSILASQATITETLLASARCDDKGFVSITFGDAGQFTCAPKADMPPMTPGMAKKFYR